jgi:hypothetical protein
MEWISFYISNLVCVINVTHLRERKLPSHIPLMSLGANAAENAPHSWQTSPLLRICRGFGIKLKEVMIQDCHQLNE